MYVSFTRVKCNVEIPHITIFAINTTTPPQPFSTITIKILSAAITPTRIHWTSNLYFFNVNTGICYQNKMPFKNFQYVLVHTALCMGYIVSAKWIRYVCNPVRFIPVFNVF